MAQARYPTTIARRAQALRAYDARPASAWSSPSRMPRPANDNWRAPPRPANDNTRLANNPWIQQTTKEVVEAIAPLLAGNRALQIGRLVHDLTLQARNAMLPQSGARRMGGGWQLVCTASGGPHPAEVFQAFGYPDQGGYTTVCSGTVGLDGQGYWNAANDPPSVWNNATNMYNQSVYPFLSFYRARIYQHYSRPVPEPWNPANPYIATPGRPFPSEFERLAPEISPALLPSLSPYTAPLVMPEQAPDPIPWPLIVPARQLPNQFPHLFPREGGNHAPGQAPIELAAKSPLAGRDIVVAPITGAYIASGSSHALKQAPAGVRERKFILSRSSSTAVKVFWAARAITESIDVIREVHKALPREYQAKRKPLRETKKGERRRKPGPLEWAIALWNHWDKVDVEQALINVISNEVEDLVIGGSQRILNQRTRALWGDRYIGQGLGTKMSHAFEPAYGPGHNPQGRGVPQDIPRSLNPIGQLGNTAESFVAGGLRRGADAMREGRARRDSFFRSLER